MKQHNKDKSSKSAKPAAPAPVISSEPMWAPSWKWHATALAVIYACLTVAYFLVSLFLSRVPPPYKLREIPKELTPWLKK